MADGYDDSFSPPAWWLAELARVMKEQDWNDAAVIREAKAIDGRGKAWDASRMVKLRDGNATIQLVIAVSQAAKISPPIAIASSKDEADALDRWLATRRRENHSGSGLKAREVEGALAAAVEAAKDQTKPLPSKNERSPRGLGHRRASARRQTPT